MKILRWVLLGGLLLLLPLSASADNTGQFMQLVGYVLVATGYFSYVGYALIIAGSVYGSAAARREQRRQNARSKAQYNASLQDRTITTLRAAPAWRVVYGRPVVGGDIVDIFTTDKTVLREDGVTTYTKADALRHMVVIFATHRCQAINEIYIDGVPLGALDGSGWTTTGEFFQARADSRNVGFTTSITLPETPVAILNAFSQSGSGIDAVYTAETVTISGNTLNGPAGVPVFVDYTVSTPLPSVRVSKHLGSDTEAVDAYLASVAPTRYTSAHGMRGLTGITITLDLENQRFQGGPPNITADVTGALLYDWRKDSTVAGGSGSHRVDNPATWEHSANNALCMRDFLTQRYGFNADDDEVNAAKGIAAANACDELIDLVVGSTVTPNQPRYTCNGAFTTEAAAEAILEDLAESMAGTVVYGADWQINAGVWTPPVSLPGGGGLTDDDLRGPIELVQADTPSSQLFNGLHGQYFPAGAQSPTDINPPYQNAAFVAADGEELFKDLTLPFTDHPARARNLARIFTEKNRAGQILRYPAQLRAWGLQVGDRVPVTSIEYAANADTYRVTDWQSDAAGGPLLTLQRDYASIWDLADAATANPSQNNDQPSPWLVAALTSTAATSSNSTARRNKDGSLTPRVKVTWAAVADALVLDGGRIDLLFRRPGGLAWQKGPDILGSDTEAYFDGVTEGDFVVVELVAVNKYKARSAPVFLSVVVVGKTALPANATGVTAAAIPGGVLITWTPSTEADYMETEVRYGASWAAGTQIFKGAAAGFVWDWPTAGTYTVRVKHRDASRNESASDTTASITVGNSSLIDTGNVVPGSITQLPSPLQLSSLSVTGAAGTGTSYSNTARWTSVGTHTFTANVTGTAYLNVKCSAAFSGTPPLAFTDKVDCTVRVNIDYDNNGTSAAGDTILLEEFYAPTPSGVFISATRECSTRKQYAVTQGTTYTWPIYAQKFEGTLTISAFEFSVEVINR